MQVIAIIAICAGAFLYLCKWASFALLCPRWIKTRIHGKPMLLGFLDLFFGYLAMHVISMAGGAVMAMLTLISFSVCSMVYIGLDLLVYKGTSWYKESIHKV